MGTGHHTATCGAHRAQVNPVGNPHFHLTKETGCEHSCPEPDHPGLRVGRTEVTGIVRGLGVREASVTAKTRSSREGRSQLCSRRTTRDSESSPDENRPAGLY